MLPQVLNVGFKEKRDDNEYTGGQVPVLCYHQVRDWKSTDSKFSRDYIVPVLAFKQQIKILHDSGYHAILPDQLIVYIEHNEKLPAKPVMLTFDDADESQITNALPELERYGYKATFFIMTVVLGHPNYMTRAQVAQLAAAGHIIGCHTYDHHRVTRYTQPDWALQIEKPRAELEKITGLPVKYFAYPYGLWNREAVERLKGYGFTAAFQLAEKRAPDEPLYTMRRIIADGNWNAHQLLAAVKTESRKPEAGRIVRR